MNIKSAYPLVTIGLPIYNGVITQNEKILRDSLDSYINQDYPNLEIIICDNNSTDNTFLICQEYAKKFPFILLKKNNADIGHIANLQKIVKEARGKYFLFASADDIYHSTYITKCVEALECTGRVACQSYMKGGVNGESRYHFLSIDASNMENFKKEFEKIAFMGNDDGFGFWVHYAHALVLTRCAKIVFKFNSLWQYTVFHCFIFAWMGGLGVVEEYLYEKKELVPFQEKYPDDIFVKNWKNKRYMLLAKINIVLILLRLRISKDIKFDIFYLFYFWFRYFGIKSKLYLLFESNFPYFIKLYKKLKHKFIKKINTL